MFATNVMKSLIVTMDEDSICDSITDYALGDVAYCTFDDNLIISECILNIHIFPFFIKLVLAAN